MNLNIFSLCLNVPYYFCVYSWFFPIFLIGLALCLSISTISLSLCYIYVYMGFLGGQMIKNPPANAGDKRDRGLVPGSGRSPEVGYSNSLQYFCLENTMYRGNWQATVHEVTKSDTTEQLSIHTCTHVHTHKHTYIHILYIYIYIYIFPPCGICYRYFLLIFPLVLFMICGSSLLAQW